MCCLCLSLQDAAAELLLRHPHLASTRQQLAHLSAFLTHLPGSIGIPRGQLQQVLVSRPNLMRYSSPDALAAKVAALRPLFPGQGGRVEGPGEQFDPMCSPCMHCFCPFSGHVYLASASLWLEYDGHPFHRTKAGCARGSMTHAGKPYHLYHPCAALKT